MGTKKVPLIMYAGANKKEIGTAEVNEETGAIVATVTTKDEEVLSYLGTAGAISIGPMYPPRMKGKW